MPSVTSQSSRATVDRAAHRVAKASASAITWSAANEPITASGSRRSRIAAARPIAAIESRGDGSASTASGSSSGSCSATAARCAAPVTTTTPVARERREPVDGPLEQGAAAAGEVVQELRGRRTATAATAGCRRRRPGSRPRSGRSSDMRGSLGAHDDLRRVLARQLRGRCRAAAGHVLRRRDRRARRAVGDDVRQLGGQDRLPARRRARPRARPGAARGPADPLAGPGLPRRGLDGRAWR